MRIVSWNIENVRPHLASLPRLAHGLGDPDMLCLQEVRLKPDEAHLLALPGYSCHSSLCNDPRNVPRRAHGVATFLRQTLGPSAAQAPPWDREGRVLVSAIEGL